MSVSYEVNLQSIDFSRSFLKKESTKQNTFSVALAKEQHIAGKLESQTHLLDVTSEHAALAIACANQDPNVHSIITVVDNYEKDVQGNYLPNPITLKLLADHARRTGQHIKYTVQTRENKELFTHNTKEHMYQPEHSPLEKIKSWAHQSNERPLKEDEPIVDQLRAAASKGMHTHFSANTTSLYGAAVVANNKIYSAGVYSSFDHRMNLHAEMVAALSAFAQGNKNITHVAVISTKFTTKPANMCGCCRQFFSEIQEKTKTSIKVLALQHESDIYEEFDLHEHLPHSWSSQS